MVVKASQHEQLLEDIDLVIRWVDGWKIKKSGHDGKHVVTSPAGDIVSIHQSSSDVNTYKVVRRQLNQFGFGSALVAAKLRFENARQEALDLDRVKETVLMDAAREASLHRAATGVGQPSLAQLVTPWPTPRTFEHVIITPDMATALLTLNTGVEGVHYRLHNRNMANRDVGDWVELLRRGEWLYTHQGIGLTNETPPMIVDGQTRLTAIERSGIAAEMMVTIGLKPETFMAVDTQRKRSPHGNWTAEGIKSTFDLQAIVRIVMLIDEGKDPRLSRLRTYTNRALDQKMHADIDAFQRAISEGRIIANGAQVPRLATEVFCYLARRSITDPILDKFLNEVKSGEHLQFRDPALFLARWLRNAKDLKVITPVQLGVWLLAWKDRCLDKPAPQSGYRLMKTSPFPTLHIPEG